MRPKRRRSAARLASPRPCLASSLPPLVSRLVVRSSSTRAHGPTMTTMRIPHNAGRRQCVPKKKENNKLGGGSLGMPRIGVSRSRWTRFRPSPAAAAVYNAQQRQRTHTHTQTRTRVHTRETKKHCWPAKNFYFQQFFYNGPEKREN